MSIDRDLVAQLAMQATLGSDSRPAAVSTLVAAATDILVVDIGPAGAIETLERLVAIARAVFNTEGSVQ